ncbi:hypothetical protein BWZ20_11015 [Winogradskyella sp. J14-2]|uniref:T9SS type A sorting domain-containing protein n=1 Tax=Winogradskyella sp. J14-2 TaxID=1936080 RepID=UPI00097296ED|nr:T9SS type A sorting domain-containing protein [Winogradskyella sp. J14-2]APY08797.1 hypothetical protein BWZ20_11015 [Winogradskyella sp. J14-2]
MKLGLIYWFLPVFLSILCNNYYPIDTTPELSYDATRCRAAGSDIYRGFVPQGQLRLSLYEDSALANSASPSDGFLIFFDSEGNNDIDIYDALDIPNLDENFSTNNNGLLFSIESRATPLDEEEIQLEVNTYRNSNYTIVAEGISMQCATAFLLDTYLNISTEIPQSGSVNYSYSINLGVPASLANDRFKLVFSANPLQLIWDGSVSNNWNDPYNWIPNQVPGPCSEVTLLDAEQSPLISGDIIISALSIYGGQNLTVPNGTSLSIIGDLNMYSESDSYSGIIVKGTIAVQGTTKYHRYTNSELNNRDLISPPLSGQSWFSFLTEDNNHNSEILFNNGALPPNTVYLFGPFEKGNVDDYVVYNHNVTETLFSSRGYRVATNTPALQGNGEALVFTGSILTEPINVTIENDFTGDFPQWNLIGNPYASYIDIDAFLNHVGSVSGVTNLSLLDESTAAIYGYDANDADQSGSNWTIANLLEGPALIAPGQGFFVSSKLPSATLEFTPNMQVEGNSDDFIVGRTLGNNDFIKLRLSTIAHSCFTSLYFHDSASLGLDVGYDASIFGGVLSDLALYSHLIEDNEGRPMAIQAVNSEDISNVIIPLGVTASKDLELRFSIDDFSVSDTVNVYLEDVVTNTMTLLNNTDYVLLPQINISGTGRFFLRITESVLSSSPSNLGTLSIFLNSSTNELVIKGLIQEKTKLTIYDLQGRLIQSLKLNLYATKNLINLSSLSKGVYVVEFSSKTKVRSKKVVIN